MADDDRDELFALVRRERFARDVDDWEGLVAAYHPDARVRVTWFEGSPREFAERSRGLLSTGSRGVHEIAPVWARVAGDRALVESTGGISARTLVGDVECDLTVWCRWFSRAVRTGAGWRLMSFDGIYNKDRFDAVDTSRAIPLDRELLASLRPSYRHLGYMTASHGNPADQELPGLDRPELVAELYAQADAWLAG